MKKERVGVGICTCNRPDYLKKLLSSIERNDIELVVINDGDKFECPGYNYYVHNNETNLGVAKSKNIAFKKLLELDCDHIFLIEDDMIIKDNSVFEKYIEASKVSGIQHFNFSQHGNAKLIAYPHFELHMLGLLYGYWHNRYQSVYDY